MHRPEKRGQDLAAVVPDGREVRDLQQRQLGDLQSLTAHIATCPLCGMCEWRGVRVRPYLVKEQLLDLQELGELLSTLLALDLLLLLGGAHLHAAVLDTSERRGGGGVSQPWCQKYEHAEQLVRTTPTSYAG